MMEDEKRTIPQLETEDEFIKTINSEGVHVVEFVAGWCRKCKTLNGKMEYFAVEHPEVSFDKIDVNMVPQDFIKSQNVTKMPTVKIFVSGKSMYEKVGFETVREILDEVEFSVETVGGGKRVEAGGVKVDTSRYFFATRCCYCILLCFDCLYSRIRTNTLECAESIFAK